MKAGIIILLAVLTLGCGCKKEAEQVDRYKVFSATWEDTELSGQQFTKVPEKALIKVDSVTGRVWYYWYHCDVGSTNGQMQTVENWVEMPDPRFHK